MHIQLHTPLPAAGTGAPVEGIKAIAVGLQRNQHGYVLQIGLAVPEGTGSIDASAVQLVHHVPLGGALERALVAEVEAALRKQRLELTAVTDTPAPEPTPETPAS